MKYSIAAETAASARAFLYGERRHRGGALRFAKRMLD
jgi:hypothetical protein